MSFFDHVPGLGYSNNLHLYLKGLSASSCSYDGSAIYPVVTLVVVVVSLLAMLNYYYGFCSNPRYTYRRVWLFHLLVAGLICGGFAYARAAGGLPAAKHCKEYTFSTLDCWLFGSTAVLYTWIFCFLFSLLLKWKSTANKKIPF